jgi:hypothetical protein
MASPPVVGETYLVPCIRINHGNEIWDVPVFGTVHSDPELGLAASFDHLHIDQRFVTEIYLNKFHYCGINNLFAKPEASMTSHRWLTLPVLSGPDIRGAREEKPMECLREAYFTPYTVNRDRSVNRWFTGDSLNHFGKFEDKYANTTLKACKVCPHRGIPLGSMPVRDGLITCPGHGLDFDACTGKLVRRTKRELDTYDYTYSATAPVSRVGDFLSNMSYLAVGFAKHGK